MSTSRYGEFGPIMPFEVVRCVGPSSAGGDSRNARGKMLRGGESDFNISGFNIFG